MGKSALFRIGFGLVVMVSLIFSGFAAARPSQLDRVIIPPGSNIQLALASWMGWPAYQDHIDAVEMALADYGPIQGFDTAYQLYDAGCSEPEGAAAGTAIISDTANLGVIGPVCSSSTHGMAPLLESAHLVMISATNTQPDLWQFGPGVFNRVILPDPFFEDWDLEVSTQVSVKDWTDQFEALYARTPDTFAKYHYDAAMLLLQRIDEVAVPVGDSLEVDRTALAAAVRDTEGYWGVTGDITLNVTGDRIDTLVPFIDNFDGPAMLPEWSWIREDPAFWSLTDIPGSLSITLQDGAFGTHNSQNTLVQEAPPADFELVTRMSFEPTENFQFAGVLVYGDDINYMLFGRAFCGFPAPGCTDGQGIYFDYILDGDFIDPNFAMTTTVPMTDTYLQVIRAGDIISGFVSADGYRWDFVGAHDLGFEPTGVGLALVNGDQETGSPVAVFDYYLIDTPPAFKLFLPLAQR